MLAGLKGTFTRLIFMKAVQVLQQKIYIVDN